MASVRVRVRPKSRRDGICGWRGGRLLVQVSAAAERGAANDALISLLAAALGIGTSRIRIRSGFASPQKVIEVDGVTDEQVHERLQAVE